MNRDKKFKGAKGKDFKKGNDFKRNNRRNRDDQPEEVFVWTPKTVLGREVLAGKFNSMRDLLLSGRKILEPEITDTLLPSIKSELINIGQQKGKFGGGKRKNSRNTQKVTREGSTMSFSVMAVVGNNDGFVGVGIGKSRETVPAREKALKNAKKNMIMIKRGCGDWSCFCATPHSIPFTIEGKFSSCVVKLIPAPKGTGLVVEPEMKKLLELAGITDVWSQSFGQTKNKLNFIRAGMEALKQLEKVRLMPSVVENRGMKEGDKNE